MLPIVTFSWAEFAAGILSALGAVSGWTQREVDPVLDLTARLRHPIRWRLQHPVRAIRRLRKG
jgi:hypothetical protein